MGADSFLRPGYGLFWVVNSINATVMGADNRALQKQIADDNEAFQIELEKARNYAQDEAEAEKIAYRRRMIVLSRQWREELSANSLSKQLQAIQVQSLVANWPLKLLPDTILSEIKCQSENGLSKKLNVILLHAPLLSGKNGGTTIREAYILKDEALLYQDLEYRIQTYDAPLIGDIDFRKDACSEIRGGNSDIMNIHFLMSSLPTLVISPRYHDGKISFIAAAWEAQATRPLIRSLFDMDYNPKMALANEGYRSELTELYHYAISAITGIVRDNYAVLTLGKEPTLASLVSAPGNERMRQFITQEPQIARFIKQEHENTLAALKQNNTPKLWDVYDAKDIKHMEHIFSSQMEALTA